MIQITPTSVLIHDANVTEMAEEFAETGCVRMPGFLDSRLVKHMLTWLKTANFEVKTEKHEGNIFGTTLFVPRTEPSLFLIHFILNRPELFRLVEDIAGCATLGNFTGRLHSTGAESAQHIDWHDDSVHTRTVGLNINLAPGPYEGGLFQIRDARGAIRSEVGRTAPGDAFLFRIGGGWQHRLTPVHDGLRTVAVGWFQTHPIWTDYSKREFLSRMQPASHGL
jgi:hypothetical protein